jgi:hypothetical protein
MVFNMFFLEQEAPGLNLFHTFQATVSQNMQSLSCCWHYWIQLRRKKTLFSVSEFVSNNPNSLKEKIVRLESYDEVK